MTTNHDAVEAAERVRELACNDAMFANFMADTSFDSPEEMQRFIRWFDEPGRIPSGWDVTRYARAQMALAYSELKSRLSRYDDATALTPDRVVAILGTPDWKGEVGGSMQWDKSGRVAHFSMKWLPELQTIRAAVECEMGLRSIAVAKTDAELHMLLDALGIARKAGA